MKLGVILTHPRISHLMQIRDLLSLFNSDPEYCIKVLVSNKIDTFAFKQEFPNIEFIGIKYEEVEEESKRFLLNESTNFDLNIAMKESFKSNIVENDQTRMRIYNILKSLHPNFIIRDSIEITGLQYGRDNNLPVVSVITNNSYSVDFLFEDMRNFQLYFSKVNQPEIIFKITKNYFRKALINGYKLLNNDLGVDCLYPLYNACPNDDLNVICTYNFFQPPISKGERSLVWPSDIQGRESGVISIKEKAFLESKSKYVYFSSGSYIQLPFEYLDQFVKPIIENGYRLFISCSNNLGKLLQEKYGSKTICSVEFCNQIEILKNATLFVTTGGINSIFESIYCQTPMFVIPQNSEQILNGTIIENLGIGITETNIRNIDFDTTQLYELIFNSLPEFQENLVMLKSKMNAEYNEIAAVRKQFKENLRSILGVQND